MSLQVIDLECPGCGSPVSTKIKYCECCGRPIVICSFYNGFLKQNNQVMQKNEIRENLNTYKNIQSTNSDNEEINTSLAMCQMKLKLFKEAHKNFETIIENGTENSEVYFWNAVNLLEGKRPFLVQRSVLNDALNYTNTALEIENRGIYSFFKAYIKYDYYFQKRLNVNPNYVQELEEAQENNLADEDINVLEEVLGVEIPAKLRNIATTV